MNEIREWVELEFGGRERMMILELGSHVGQDTAWMAAIPGAFVHCFEPDPRNHQPPRPNVEVHQTAVGDRDGACWLRLSEARHGRPYTKSSSILRPTEHLRQHPDVSFGALVEVDCITLDTFAAQHGIEAVDFIWADVQGAEALMIKGGPRTLARTRYLYTEYSDVELYEGQPSLDEILLMLPGWRVLRRWAGDVLLSNGEYEH